MGRRHVLFQLVFFCASAFGSSLADWDQKCQQYFPDEPVLLNFTDVQSFIARHSITSPYEFVKGMAGDAQFAPFLNSYLLMHTSRSAQKQSVDREHPRVIFFYRGMILGVTDHPDAQVPRIEVIHYNQAEFRFEFKVVDFRRSEPFINKPGNCKGCHGSDLLPIWATYRNWPGSFSSADEFLMGPGPELAALSPDEAAAKKKRLRELYNGDFLGSGRTRLQSQQLNQEEMDALEKLFEPVRVDRKGTIYEFLSDTSSDGPASFNEFLNNYNFQRIRHEMEISPGYDRLRYAMGAALLECPDLPGFLGKNVPLGLSLDAIEKDVTLKMTQQFQARLEYAKSINDPVAMHETAMNDSGDIKRIAGLRYLFEPGGVNVKRFSLNFAPREFEGYGFSRIGAGGGGLRFGFCRFIPALVKEDAELAPLLELDTTGFASGTDKAPMCDLLRRKSLELN